MREKKASSPLLSAGALSASFYNQKAPDITYIGYLYVCLKLLQFNDNVRNHYAFANLRIIWYGIVTIGNLPFFYLLKQWMVNGEVCIGLFALRDIKKVQLPSF